MRTFLYALQFTGAATPDATGVLKLKGTAESGSIRMSVGSEDGAGVEPGVGGRAELESEVTMLSGDGAFLG